MGFFGPTKQSKKSENITLNQITFIYYRSCYPKNSNRHFCKSFDHQNSKAISYESAATEDFLKPSRRTKNKNVEKPSPKNLYLYT